MRTAIEESKNIEFSIKLIGKTRKGYVEWKTIEKTIRQICRDEIRNIKTKRGKK